MNWAGSIITSKKNVLGLLQNLKKVKHLHRRNYTKFSEDLKHQNELFTKEQKRQKEAVGRVEKIEINYVGVPEPTTFIMNRNMSTPNDCAKHISEMIERRSAVALLNNETLWHMHKPLPESCTLDFLHYFSPQPAAVNKAFWRTCSFILGAIIRREFKDDIEVQLHSFPSPAVKSGSFVYDVQLTLEDWKPKEEELKVLSIEMIKFCQNNYDIEYLDVSPELALEMFKNNPHKTKQIPDIASQNDSKVTIFRAGDHVDISRGPMVSNTGHIGRVTVANAIKLKTDIEGAPIYRFQGVSLPSAVVINHYAYSLLEERARDQNSARIPSSTSITSEDYHYIAQTV